MTARFTLDAPIASALNDVPPTPTEMAAVRFVKELADHVDVKNGPHMPSDRLAARTAPLHKGQETGSRQLAIDDQLCGSAAAAVRREAQIEAIYHTNIARRDQAAREYGEPETPHEFYAGRPGSKAERIVLDCLRELRAIPEADRLYAHELTDAISKIYLETADASDVRMRRIAALLEVGIGA